ncbi:hypothetical protein [Flavobacterium hercynium]|uniref:Peptidase S1 domain-containing protein n=1 Tax=Flavobacterium hercynium TaxID=387094 RepID=A0A226HIV1_9FLAO|nr:hypothetical protein [Flavobacterium hercynium]OXA93798.1 hypothetical protein B0A66_05985 [Flavobacterium hercynium]SMP20352.1 hypothetical protein SAMN06265346_106166 [Flavobacterium hercynium]
MKRDTRDYVSSIQKHIQRNYKRWFRTYSGLRGVHVGKKYIKGKPINEYSVVFHVDVKIGDASKKVPSYIRVNHNGDKILVSTDVIESGKLELQGIKMGDTVKNVNSTMAGTISVYMHGNHGIYICSNMHVLAPGLLGQGQLYYDIRKEKNTPEQFIEFYDQQSKSEARLMVSRFDGIDFGIAQLKNIGDIMEDFKGYGPMTGFLTLNNSNYKLFKMLFSGRISGAAKQCKIMELGAIKETDFQGIFLTNLIKLQKCTDHGDSGAPLFDLKGRLAGVMVGFDQDWSYALHINDIIRFFQSTKL